MNLHRFLTRAAFAAVALVAATSASAVTYTYNAVLNAANEPGNVNAPNANGIAIVTFDDAVFSVAVQQIWVGLTGPISVNHIHCCTATAGTGTAGVVLGFNPPATASGFYSDTFTLAPAAFNTLLMGTAAGKAYVNIHTAANPGGEIRGFLNGPTLPVPEPATYAMLLGGLGVMGMALRRRKQA